MNQKSGNSGDSVEHDKELIRPEEPNDKFAHQIWDKSDKRFAY